MYIETSFEVIGFSIMLHTLLFRIRDFSFKEIKTMY